MAAEQLERSILERKERDELHAIASAMSLKPAARSKKSDIIDLILRATGVDVDAEAAANGASPRADAVNGNGSFDTSTVFEPATETADKSAPAPETARVATNGTGRPRRAPRAGAASGADEGATAAAGSDESHPDRSAAADAAAGESAAGESAAGESAAGESAAGGSAESATSSPADSSAGARSERRRESARNGSSAQRRTPTVTEDADANDFAEFGGTTVRPNGVAEPGNGGTSHAPGGQVGSQFPGDAGNRRGRRRRGRDRDRSEPGAPGQEAPWQGELVPVKGLLDLREEGYGFLRTSGYLASQKDVYVSVSQARRFALRKGDAIEGACRPAGSSEKYPALIRIDSVGGLAPEEARSRPRFEDLTPLFPDSTLHLEMPGDPANLTARIVDLISPIGKGQRGMIVSPPKAGKTTIMKQIAHSIEANNPDVHLIVLLVDERPEEVTDMRRSVRGEVIASTFDRPADEHTAVAELTIERAKRLVEIGRDVVIILDGITRLARAYNLAQPATGRIMSGGVDSGALYPPKRFFGAARNIEEGGSLTILATALVETGSKMDEVIFEEFKGTGNMELRLDRRLAERRLYPAIDVNASSTRHEELLFGRSELQQVWKLRRVLNALGNEGNAAAGLELLIDKIRTTRSNEEFLAEIAKAPSATA